MTDEALILGYDSAIEIEIVGGTLPPSATFRAHVKDALSDAAPRAELTTANGRIERLAADRIVLRFGAETADWPTRPLLCDVVRTDLVAPAHLGFILSIQFAQPVTRRA